MTHADSMLGSYPELFSNSNAGGKKGLTVGLFFFCSDTGGHKCFR